MAFCEDIRIACRAVVAGSRFVRIDDAALAEIAPGEPPRLDPESHFVEGAPEAVATYVLALDAINFGSGWFSELGPGFGYETVAAGLAAQFRAGPVELARASGVGAWFGIAEEHPLAVQFTDALRELGALLAEAPALELVAGHSAEQLAARLVEALPTWRDPLAKRAQLVGSDLVLAGVASFTDLGALTLFADNLVPHVLWRDGALVLEAELAGRLERGELLEPGREELELRAACVVAGERLARRLEVSERDLDGMLWQRGQAARYAEPPAFRCRTTAY